MMIMVVLFGYAVAESMRDAWSALFVGGGRWSRAWTVRHVGFWVARYYWPAVLIAWSMGQGSWSLAIPVWPPWTLMFAGVVCWVGFQVGLLGGFGVGILLGGHRGSIWRTSLERYLGVWIWRKDLKAKP